MRKLFGIGTPRGLQNAGDAASLAYLLMLTLCCAIETVRKLVGAFMNAVMPNEHGSAYQRRFLEIAQIQQPARRLRRSNRLAIVLKPPRDSCMSRSKETSLRNSWGWSEKIYGEVSRMPQLFKALHVSKVQDFQSWTIRSRRIYL